MTTSEVSMREQVEALLGTVDSIMRRKVVVLHPHSSLQEAIRELERADVSGGPVLEGEQIVGMVSLADLFRTADVDPTQVAISGPWHRYERFVGASRRTVADAMTRRIVTVRSGTTIADTAGIMRANDVNRVPVVDESGRLIGIVARDDIVGAVAAASRTVHARRVRRRSSRLSLDRSGTPGLLTEKL